MEAALTEAGFSGADVDYLEAHATGSQLGDAIEAHAVGSVYGKGREEDRPLLMGTVKSNIGHLEAAAGVAGLIKAVLSMKQGVIPKHLHFETPNPQIEWSSLPLRVTSEKVEWPICPDRQPRAAVSAFGISGTNAHVILEGYESKGAAGNGAIGIASFMGNNGQVAVSLPRQLADLAVPTDALEKRRTRLLPLSGRSDGALQELARRYISWLDNRPGLTDERGSEVLADMAWTAFAGRSHFEYRAGVAFEDVRTLREGLSNVVGRKGMAEGEEPRPAQRVAFVYSGDGSQWISMSKSLYEIEPVVRAVLDRCDAIVRGEKGTSLLEAMFSGSGAGEAINDSALMQPALYSLQCAFTSLWASIGIDPKVVLGFGSGEIAAAQAADILSMADGLRIALARGELMSITSGEDSNQLMNGLEAALTNITFSTSTNSMVSSATGQVVDSGMVGDAGYWLKQTRESASPSVCAGSLAELGVDLVVEIGPVPTLRQAIADTRVDASDVAVPITVLGTASSEEELADGHGEFVKAVAGAYTAGLGISFDGLFSGEARRRVAIPTYPFQRRRHWI